jgi:lipopolysaccharide biosynthesis regulator YciM
MNLLMLAKAYMKLGQLDRAEEYLIQLKETPLTTDEDHKVIHTSYLFMFLNVVENTRDYNQMLFSSNGLFEFEQARKEGYELLRKLEKSKKPTA